MVNKSTRLEKIGIYVAALGLLFMFWQGWRDVSKEINETRNQTTANTKDIEFLQEKINELLEKK